VKSLYRRFVDTHDDHGLVKDVVDHEIAGLFDLLQPARHLPDVRPELLTLEFVELAVVIAACIDTVRPRDGEGNAGLDSGARGLGHVLPQPGAHPAILTHS
jgi:hypothetical protein